MPEQKIALLFPGQGTQYAGMGKDIYEDACYGQSTREVYEKSCGILGRVTSLFCFNSTLQKISFKKTNYTQIAVFVTNHAFYNILNEKFPGLKYYATAGHSLGQYNALVASGAVSFEDALQLVQKRADYMGKVSRQINGGLLALIGNFDESSALKLNEELKTSNVCITLFNSPRQIVIGGKKINLEEIAEKLKEKKIRSAKVDVQGPFHTPYMEKAADMLKEDIFSTPFNLATVPVVANSSARFIVDPKDIEHEIYEQISSPVKWSQSLKRMAEEGIDLYVVAGADKNEFVRKTIEQTNKNAKVLVAKDIRSLDDAVCQLTSISLNTCSNSDE